MKKLFVLLSTIVLTSSFSAIVYAAPVNFIFTGNVGDIIIDAESFDIAFDELPYVIRVGDTASYTIQIDSERIGTQTTWDGTQYVTEEVDTGVEGIDAFYSQYLEGFLIDDSLITTTASPALFNYGYFFITSLIFVGSADHGLSFMTFDGINWVATEHAEASDGSLISIQSGGTLAPVPLPASLPLMLSALIGFAGFCRKSRAAC
jgi:hypothetical protein